MAKNPRLAKSVSSQLPAPINPRGIQSVYCNNMEIQFSSIDARITFNEIIADHGIITVERRAHIVMPLQHVGPMVQALTTAMAQAQGKIKEQSKQAAKK